MDDTAHNRWSQAVGFPFDCGYLAPPPGGLAAFAAFFSGMPPLDDPGMAFVLVQHLAPDHESLLTELLQRTTRMKVVEVTDGMVVQINCVYIIPPNRDMAFLNGALHLLEPTAARGHRLPIDYLFSSLAQDQHERAYWYCAVGHRQRRHVRGSALSRRRRWHGHSAEPRPRVSFDSMPRSAWLTGFVDHELPPAENACPVDGLHQPRAFIRPPRTPVAALPQSESALKKIFVSAARPDRARLFGQYKLHHHLPPHRAAHGGTPGGNAGRPCAKYLR
ncbi:MAG: chemotaxis protein CheB [Burkholderiales bacterium]|nr:chemotaxis protein CheB [Burkholderiales bacterium]